MKLFKCLCHSQELCSSSKCYSICKYFSREIREMKHYLFSFVSDMTIMVREDYFLCYFIKPIDPPLCNPVKSFYLLGHRTTFCYKCGRQFWSSLRMFSFAFEIGFYTFTEKLAKSSPHILVRGVDFNSRPLKSIGNFLSKVAEVSAEHLRPLIASWDSTQEFEVFQSATHNFVKRYSQVCKNSAKSKTLIIKETM